MQARELSETQINALICVKYANPKTLGEALKVMDDFEALLQAIDIDKKSSLVRDVKLWNEIIKIFGFNVCQIHEIDSCYYGFFEFKEDFSPNYGSAWKQFRLSMEDGALFLINNYDNVFVEKAAAFSYSKDYLVILKDKKIIVYIGHPSLGPFQEIDVSSLKILYFEVAQIQGGLIILLDLEEGNNILLFVGNDHILKIKRAPPGTNGLGYLGMYFTDELRFYESSSEMSNYFAPFCKFGYQVSSTGYENVDFIKEHNERNLFYNPLTSSIFWSTLIPLKIFDGFVFCNDTVFDIITGRIILHKNIFPEDFVNFKINNITKKEDGTGFIIWLVK